MEDEYTTPAAVVTHFTVWNHYAVWVENDNGDPIADGSRLMLRDLNAHTNRALVTAPPGKFIDVPAASGTTVVYLLGHYQQPHGQYLDWVIIYLTKHG
jgi:hypothetical protein